VDAAIVIAKHSGWSLIRRFDDWGSFLERRLKEMVAVGYQGRAGQME